MRSLIPLTMREMHLLGRRRSVYAVRAIVALLGAAALLLVGRHTVDRAEQVELAYQKVTQFEAGRNNTDFWDEQISSLAEGIASNFAATMLLFQIVVAFFVPPLLASSPIAHERQDGTLALLRLADVRGGDVWCAKFAAAFAQSELLLLSTLPLAAFASFFGGVSVEGMAVQVAILTCFVALLTAASLLIGVRAGSPNRALLLAMSTSLFLLCLLLPELPLAALDLIGDDPDTRIQDEWLERRIMLWSTLTDLAVHGIAGPAMGGQYSIGVQRLLAAVATSAAIVALLAVAGIWSMFRMTRDRDSPRRRHPRARRTPAFPTVHLIVAGTLPPDVARSRITVLVTGAALLVVSLMPGGVGWLAILFLMCYTSAMAMDGFRNNHALDEVAVTPVSDLELAQSIVGVNLSRAKLCLLPLLISGVILARFYLQDFHFIRHLTVKNGWVSFDGITWLFTAAAGTAIVTVFLFLQAFSTVSITSALHASGKPFWVSAAGGAFSSALLLAVSTILPWYGLIQFERASFTLFSAHTYGYPALALIWNVVIAAAVAYCTLSYLASHVRMNKPNRRRIDDTELPGDAADAALIGPQGESALR